MSLTQSQPGVRPPTHTRPYRLKPRPQQQQQQPMPEAFDPNELSRRLLFVLADQKARTAHRHHHRSRSGGELASGSSNAPPRQVPQPTQLHNGRSGEQVQGKPSPRLASPVKSNGSPATMTPPADGRPAPYVPREAAAQFARTATGGGMRDNRYTHRASHKPLKLYARGVSAEHSGTSHAAATAAQRRKSVRRERTPNQIPSRHSPVSESDSGEQQQRQSDHSNAQTDEARLAHQRHKARRSSTGDINELVVREEKHRQSMIIIPPPEIEEEEEVSERVLVNEHRIDWTQSDEAHRLKGQLRPKTSIWTLRGRLGGKLHREPKVFTIEERPETAGGEGAMSPKIKSPRIGGFFARFKHQSH